MLERNFVRVRREKRKATEETKDSVRQVRYRRWHFMYFCIVNLKKKIDYLAKINKELNIILMMMIIIWVQFLKCLQLPIDQYQVVMLVNLHHSISTVHRLVTILSFFLNHLDLTLSKSLSGLSQYVFLSSCRFILIHI